MNKERYILEGTGNKARVENTGNVRKLFSYETLVAEYDGNTKQVTVHGYHSATTGRHINSFFKYLGLPTYTKKELFKAFKLKK